MPRPVLCKRDALQELEIQKWIEAVLNEPFPEGKLYEDALKDGVILCKLMNVLAPGSIKKIHEKGAHFKLTENVTRFQEAIAEYGVHLDDIFQTNDLSEKKDIANVNNTLFRLGVAVSKHQEWNGPQLGAN